MIWVNDRVIQILPHWRVYVEQCKHHNFVSFSYFKVITCFLFSSYSFIHLFFLLFHRYQWIFSLEVWHLLSDCSWMGFLFVNFIIEVVTILRFRNHFARWQRSVFNGDALGHCKITRTFIGGVFLVMVYFESVNVPNSS